MVELTRELIQQFLQRHGEEVSSGGEVAAAAAMLNPGNISSEEKSNSSMKPGKQTIIPRIKPQFTEQRKGKRKLEAELNREGELGAQSLSRGGKK